MGIYINPRNCSKDEWLEEHGIPVPSSQWPPPEGYAFVCLVQNPGFSAAGVCVDEREYEDFTDPTDPRPRQYFHVDRDLLNNVT